MAVIMFSRRHGELGFAAAFVAAAGLFYVKAGEYPGLAGTYPRILAIVLGIGGIVIFARTLIQQREIDNEPLVGHPGRFVIAVAVLAAYILAVTVAGYLIPSLILGIGLPLILGYRNIRLAALTTLGTLVFIVVVFVVILGRPIPRDLLDPLLVFIR